MKTKNFKKRLTKEAWNQKAYFEVARRGILTGFSKNKGLIKLKRYASEAKTVLDCGCGNATVLEKICHHKGTFFGVDIAQMGIKLGKERLKSKKNIKLLTGDLESLKFADNCFDLVYTSYVLEHLSSPEKVIQEMIRVTKKGGFLIIICPNYGSPLSHSPSSPPAGMTLTLRAVKQFFKSHLYLLKKPQDLDWIKVRPICLEKKEWQPDWDTVTEPYLQTLIYFFKREGLKIVEFGRLTGIKEGKISPRTLRGKCLRLGKEIIQRLGVGGVSPYKYYGENLFVVAQK